MEPVFCNVFFVKCSESANKVESINQSIPHTDPEVPRK